MVEQGYSVFCFGSENWSWSGAILDKIKGWETKAMHASVQIQMKGTEDTIGVLHEDREDCKNELEK